MKARKAAAGEVLFREGEQNNLLPMIAEGKVVPMGREDHPCEKGCLLGVPDRDSVFYPFTYVAKSDVTLYLYDYASYDDLNAMLATNPDAIGLIACYFSGLIKTQISALTSVISSCQVLYDTIYDEYDNYKDLCAKMGAEPKQLPGLDQLSDFNEKSELEDWVTDYYRSIVDIAPAKWKAFYEKEIKAGAGYIIRAGRDIKALLSSVRSLSTHLDMICDLLLSEYKVDLYTFYLELLEDALKKQSDITPICDGIDQIMKTVNNNSPIEESLKHERFQEYRDLLPKEKTQGGQTKLSGIDASALEQIRNELADSLNMILTYAEYSEEEAKQFKKLIRQYTEAPDRASSEDEIRLLRKSITAQYYEIYKKAFFKSLSDHAVPVPVKMFFYFGFVTSELSGEDNAVYLYILASQIKKDPKERVFTFYDWLTLIYYGEKDPSVNEFNEDYISHLHKLKVEKSITEAQEAASLKDGVQRVTYELSNMFRSVSKMISGHITTFCPVFSDHDLYKSPDMMLVKSSAVHAMLDKIRSIDFSCFYREMTYSAPEEGVQKEVIQVEVLPEIILMPGVGSRGAMWQEITGKKRTSPARFALPLFLSEDLQRIMVRLCGEFRWELCRRVQGARWNDLGERSLTSDYCDYLETYKRSRDLTPEAKEKIKSSYAKYRNSSKEMFVHDYIDYIQYEGAGALRLNKLTRIILFNYCPFRKEIRIQVSTNQIYKELVDKYNIKHAHVLHLSDLSMQKIQKSGHDVPQPVLDHRKFLEM